MKKVLLFLCQGFEAYEASVFTDVLGWTLYYGTEPVKVITSGLRSELKCTWNLIVKPELEFEKINVSDFDALAIPGGFEEAGFYEDAYDDRFLELIRSFHINKKIIASVCVGALPIGKSGILTGKNATTYDLDDGFRRKQLAAYEVNVLDRKIVIEDNIITSTGPATAIDVAFLLLEKLTSIDNKLLIRKFMRFQD